MKRYYIISYDLIEKKTKEECDDKWSNEEFQKALIKILCELKVESIEWVNETSITFISNKAIIDDVKDAIDSLEICLDYFIARIKTDKNKLPITRSKITQVASVRQFRERVKDICGRYLPNYFTRHIP